VTSGDIDGDLVARGDREGEKLGDIAVEVLKPTPDASWLMGERGNMRSCWPPWADAAPW
jgi:hypothetical protein